MASDAINDVLGGIEDTYRIAPATLQRFANGATERLNSRHLALLVRFVLQARDGDIQKGRDLIGRFMQEQAKRNLIRDFERLLDFKKPADNAWPRSRIVRFAPLSIVCSTH